MLTGVFIQSLNVINITGQPLAFDAMTINTQDGCSLRHYIAMMSRVKNELIIPLRRGFCQLNLWWTREETS